MKSFKMYPLLLMIIFAIMFVVMMRISRIGFSTISFLGYYILAALLVIDLLVIASYVCAITILKARNGQQAAKYTSIIAGGIILVFTVAFASNPLLRSEKHIRNKMLKLIPVGTSMEDVIKIIERNKKWEIEYTSHEHGYSMYGGRPSEPSPEEARAKEDTYIGEKSMRVYLGEYRIIFDTGVIVFIGFDGDSKLVNLHVRKDHDSL